MVIAILAIVTIISAAYGWNLRSELKKANIGKNYLKQWKFGGSVCQ